MHEQTGCFDPNTMGENIPSLKDNFPQTLGDPLTPSSPMVVDNTTNTDNGLEENLRLSVEELSFNHHNLQHQDGVTATSTHSQQHLGLNMDNHLVQQVIDVLPYQQSTWDPSTVQELPDIAYANQIEQQQNEQQFQQMETQSFNPSSILDPPYPSPDLLNLIHLPRCSAPSLHTNPTICLTNPTQNTPNFQNPLAFIADLPIGSDNNTSASSVLYDPLFHLNLPPQPPALRELFQSLPRGYSLPTNSRNGSLFGGDEIEGDGSQLDMGVLEFNRVTPTVAKGRGGKATKHFATEKQRREQLNGKYKILRNLIPNPTKVYIVYQFSH